MTLAPQQLIDAINARGLTPPAKSLRDAAHEAHHALSVKLRGKWDRERTNRALERRGRGRMVADEIMARAVEQIVCTDLGVECGPVEKWAGVSCMEAIKNSRLSLPYDMVLAGVQRALTSKAARKAADAVLRLAEGT